MPESNLPPEFEVLSRLVDAQEPNVCDLFQHALALWMVEDGKAEITEQRTVSMREQLTLRTVASDTFTLLKPDISDELLAQMQEIVRELLDAEQGRADRVGG